MIENYAALGGDEGLTEDMLRLACGIKARNRTDDTTPGAAAVAALVVPESQAAEPDTEQVKASGYEVLAHFLLNKCLDDAKDHLTLGMFNYIYKLPQGTPNADRSTLWTCLHANGLMEEVSTKSKKGENAMRPVVKVVSGKSPAWSLLTGTPTVREFSERHHIGGLDTYLNGHSARAFNSDVIVKSYDASLAPLRKGGRGQKSKASTVMVEQLQGEMTKYKKGEDMAIRILNNTTPPQPKKVRKASGKSAQPGSAELAAHIDIKVPYSFTLADRIRTRLQATGPAAQLCPRRVLVRLCHDTIDLDIENCMSTILYQLFQRIVVSPAMPEKLMVSTGIVWSRIHTETNRTYSVLLKLWMYGASTL